jgi:hypothetical protein
MSCNGGLFPPFESLSQPVERGGRPAEALFKRAVYWGTLGSVGSGEGVSNDDACAHGQT